MTENLGQPGLAKTEARLRRALASRAADVLPRDEAASLAALEGRVRVARRGRRLRLNILGAVSVAAAAAVVAVIPALVSGPDDDRLQTTASTVTTPVAPDVSTSGTAAPPVSAPPIDAIWPPPDHVQYADPLSATRSFVEEYVGLADPPLSRVRSLEEGAAWVSVYRRGEDGSVITNAHLSTVSLRAVDGHWMVTSANTSEIVVDNPQPGTVVGSPVVVDGKGRGYEGNIVVTVRDGSQGAGLSLAQKPVIAGCCGELVAFHVELALPRRPSRPTGSLLLITNSGIDAVANFAVVPIRFGETPSMGPQVSDETKVEVFWIDPDGTTLRTSTRTVRRSQGVLRSALQQLLLGPYSAERDAGLTTSLANGAADVPITVVINNGVAIVDFGSELPTVSSTTSSAAASRELLLQLQATVFQFPTVTKAEYRVGGSCAAFWAWLQRACTTVDNTHSGV